MLQIILILFTLIIAAVLFRVSTVELAFEYFYGPVIFLTAALVTVFAAWQVLKILGIDA